MKQVFDDWLPDNKNLPKKEWFSSHTPCYPNQLNVANYLLKISQKQIDSTDDPIFYSDYTVWSYQEFYDAVKLCAYKLKSYYGLKPKDRVLLHSYNSPALAILWFAIVYAGGVVITSPPQLKHDELHHVLVHSEIKIALSEESLIDELHIALDDLSHHCKLDQFEHLTNNLQHQKLGFDHLTPCLTNKNDIAIIAYTSGSIGLPKATAHTHCDLMSICDIFPEQILKPNKKDIFAGTPPLGFTFGLGVLLLFPIRYGASTLLIRKPKPEVLAKLVDYYKVTLLFSTPTGYRMLLNTFNQHRWSNLRLCVSAGEPLSQKTFDQWKNITGLSIINGIGTTELLHIFIATTNDNSMPRGSLGVPLHGYKAKVINKKGETLPPYHIGYLAVQGPTGCCYLKNNDAQAMYVKNGWNITGDLVYKDSVDHFYFYDRQDDLIISSGYNISSSEVEEVIMRHPYVFEAAVVGVKDNVRNKIVRAYISSQTSKITNEILIDIDNFTAKHLAKYKCPREYKVINELPKTQTGKIKKSDLK